MGSVLDSIGDFFEDVLTPIATIVAIFTFPEIALILAVVCDECESFMSEQIGKTLSWIGIEDEDVISVQVQDQKLMNDDSFYKNLMTQVALEHQRTQMGIIDLLAVKSQGVKGSLQKYSRYGKNKYLDGLPDCSINTVSVNKSAIDAAVQADVGFNVTITDVQVKVPKENEWVPYRMTDLYSMNQTTLEFNYSSDVWVMTGFYYDFGAGVYKVMAYLKSTPATTTVISIGNYVPNVGYVVRYADDATSDEYYWVYFINSGNETLDKARNYLTNLDMLPIVELRRASTSITSNKESTRYKQSKEILGFIGIDVDTIVESIESNPDISSVVATYIYFGAEIGSNNPLQAKMVYSTLEYLWLDPSLVSGGQHLITVREGNYNSSISWEKQERIIGSRTGVPIGTYEGGVGFTEVDNGYLDTDGVTWIPVINKKYYGWTRKQETADEYVEYRIWNVSAITVIMKEGLKDATMKILTSDTLVTIPISQHFLSKFSPIEQGQLLPEILRLATYAADIQHLRYYQTEAFMNLIQIVVVIIAIVIFIFTWYTGGATAGAFLTAVENLLIGMAAGYALNMLLAQIDNPALRAIVAVIAVAVMAYYGNTQGMEQSMLTLTADMVTTAVSTYSEAIMEGIAEQFANMEVEASAFLALLTQRQEEIDEKTEEMTDYVSTGDVARITGLQDVNVKIEGVDLKMYRAVQMQYEWDLLKSMKTQVAIYDYDAHYNLYA